MIIYDICYSLFSPGCADLKQWMKICLFEGILSVGYIRNDEVMRRNRFTADEFLDLVEVDIKEFIDSLDVDMSNLSDVELEEKLDELYNNFAFGKYLEESRNRSRNSSFRK